MERERECICELECVCVCVRELPNFLPEAISSSIDITTSIERERKKY